MQEAARIPYYGMRQVLYPDLTMIVAFEGFKQDQDEAKYCLLQSTFLQRFRPHVVEEIRYLALASTSGTQNGTGQIENLWPIKQVTSEAQAGNKFSSFDRCYLFKLGKPLTLQTPVINVPCSIEKSMKLTTLTTLESVTNFAEVKKVYEDVK